MGFKLSKDSFRLLPNRFLFWAELVIKHVLLINLYGVRMTESLLITEIYKSVQGESVFAGLPCTFIRLTGCPLRCKWCDTVYGFEGGKNHDFTDLLEQTKTLGVELVEITGGEPLAQKNCVPFIDLLIEEGFKVLIETSGSEDISTLHADTHVIMDIKCPDSKMEDRNLWDNLNHLKPTDEVKFVISSRRDFDWAVECIKINELNKKCNLLMSVAFGLLKEHILVDWILESNLNVRLNLQQHKYIWSPRKKGV